MQMPPFSHDRRPALLAGMLCVFFAAGLAGCASKNPLMEEPVASGTAAATPATTTGSAAEKNAVPVPAAGVQTIKERRFLGFLSPYRIDIQQGNFVSQEMV